MQAIIYGLSGQVLRHVPPAVVASASYAIEDLTRPIDDAERVIASGAAEVASWSLITTATAGPSRPSGARIPVSSTLGATVGARAAIVASDGRAELIEIAAVSLDAYVEADTALADTYAVGSTVRGVMVSAAVPAALVADEDVLKQLRPLRVVWTYVIGGTQVKAQELIEFRRHSGAATLDVGLAIQRVRKLYPDLPGRLPDYADLDSIAIELADVVDDDLRSKSIAPERMMVGPAGAQLLMLRIVAHAADLGYAPGGTPTDDGRWAKTAAARYRERLEALAVGEAGQATAETSLIADTARETPSQTYRGPTFRI